jgi:2-dehydropantoate 2-reductase
MPPRVLVAGAGALGSVFGGFLARTGVDVTLLGRQTHLDAIAADGLRIDGIWGEHGVRGMHIATATDALTPGFDAILVSVKSYDTAAIGTAAAPLLSQDGVIISLQNGLGNVETLETIAGAQRVVGARVIFGAIITAPGAVRVTVIADPTAVGARAAGTFPSLDRQARAWAERFDRAGVPSTYTDRLTSMLWGKVLYSAALNPLGALLGVHYGALGEHDDSRAIMNAAIDEAFAVATAEGVPLTWPSAAAYREEFYARLLPSTYDHRSSMLQDLERGRCTEIDAITGEAWRRGRQHGIVTPVNEMLTRLIHLRESQHQKDLNHG